MIKVAVVGTRPPSVTDGDARYKWFEYDCIIADVKRFIESLKDQDWQLITGGAAGVDSVAASCCGHQPIIHLPDYKKHGATAPLVRNTKIILEAFEVHAWPSSWSKGTLDAIRKAREHNKFLTVHEPIKENSK